MANLQGRGNSIPVMGGATATKVGYEGLVPAPRAGDQDKVLSGAGTWVNAGSGGGPEEYVKRASVNESGDTLTLTDQDDVTIEFKGGGTSEVMKGATATEDGKAGLVPAPMAGDEGKLLDGSGSWHGTKEILVDADTMEVDEQDEAIVIGTRMKDSPSDGVTYGRKAGRWVPVNTQIEIESRAVFCRHFITGTLYGDIDLEEGKTREVLADAQFTNLLFGYDLDNLYYANVNQSEPVSRILYSVATKLELPILIRQVCCGEHYIYCVGDNDANGKQEIYRVEKSLTGYSLLTEVSNEYIVYNLFMYDDKLWYTRNNNGVRQIIDPNTGEVAFSNGEGLVLTLVIKRKDGNGYLAFDRTKAYYFNNDMTLDRYLSLNVAGYFRWIINDRYIPGSTGILVINDDYSITEIKTSTRVSMAYSFKTGAVLYGTGKSVYEINGANPVKLYDTFVESDVPSSLEMQGTGLYLSYSISYQAQGDWDVNDETSPAFIRNKPVLDGWSAPVSIAPIPKYASYVGTNSLYAKYNPALKLLMLYGYVQFTSGFTPAYSASDGGGSSDWPMVFTCQLPGVTTSVSGFFQLQVAGSWSYKTLEVVLKASGKLEVRFPGGNSFATGLHNIINSMLA